MSYLSEKYNVPEETAKSMIKDGVISCSWVGYEKILDMHSKGKTAFEISVETGYSTRWIRSIIAKGK